jgi:hypothetical protein
LGMVVLNKSGFRLPRVEREKFIVLMRLGLNYDREKGIFCLVNYNNIEKLRDTLADILKVDEVTFAQICVSCGKDFPCAGCKYYEKCDTKNLPYECVCPQCLRGEKPQEAQKGQTKLF